MALTVSNPRDLLLLLLGEQLYVERRLAAEVLRTLSAHVTDEELRSVLDRHREETAAHVDRLETAFRRLEAAPSSNRSAPFEAAVAQHDELAASFADTTLADVFHARAALRTEYDEIADYTAIFGVAEAAGLAHAVEELRSSLAEEERARALLGRALERLAAARAR